VAYSSHLLQIDPHETDQQAGYEGPASGILCARNCQLWSRLVSKKFQGDTTGESTNWR